MKLAIMQPYFLPYPGYFQLIAAVDVFVVYDNIKYVKSGWINRNRLCRNGEAATFSLPLKHASDSLDVRERELAAAFDPQKLLNQFRGAYGQAPQFARVFAWLEQVIRHGERNLFRYLEHSIRAACDLLAVGTEIRTSSDIAIDHTLKKQDKVLALCRAAGARTYVNAIGGTDLYDKEEFRRQGIELQFLRSKPFEYPQLEPAFVPSLSIVDALMFNSLEIVRARVADHYELI
jgi:WbqC-like protein